MSAPGYTLYLGDCRDSLRAMAADGVKAQMCVTSILASYGAPRAKRSPGKPSPEQPTLFSTLAA